MGDNGVVKIKAVVFSNHVVGGLTSHWHCRAHGEPGNEIRLAVHLYAGRLLGDDHRLLGIRILRCPRFYGVVKNHLLSAKHPIDFIEPCRQHEAVFTIGVDFIGRLQGHGVAGALHTIAEVPLTCGIKHAWGVVVGQVVLVYFHCCSSLNSDDEDTKLIHNPRGRVDVVYIL